MENQYLHKSFCYLVLNLPDDLDTEKLHKKLNECGQAGWELIAVRRMTATEPLTHPTLFAGAPADPPHDFIAYAEQHIRFPGSVRSEAFDSSITPWTREPIQRCFDLDTRRVTLIKPIQTGGSRVGLIALIVWAKFFNGHLQYNWEKDEKAKFKWKIETLPTLLACLDLDWSMDRFAAVNCFAKFVRGFIQSQGVFVPDSLDSDSIRYQVNEEIHSWKPGHLAKARGRQTAVWRPKAVDISNASFKGDQLHSAFEEGTMQYWNVKCPGCSNPHHEANSVFHAMQGKWDERHPEAGGLRYDSTGCKLDNGKFNYNKLEKTIRYQMPCGFEVRDTPAERRALSLSGRYSDPTNPGAHLSHRSYTYEAVSVDFIPWLLLIQEKHAALRARDSGDIEPWKKYLNERECRFIDKQDLVPNIARVVMTPKLKKSREGLAGRHGRNFALDRQKGRKAAGESPHWWLVIRDIMSNGDSCLVYEGKMYTEMDVLNTLEEYKCERHAGVADATWDTANVSDFCYRNGIHAFWSTGERDFSHGPEGRKIFSVEETLHKYLNRPPRYDYVGVTSKGKRELIADPREPMYWRVSRFGMMDRLAWIRASSEKRRKGDANCISWEVPDDVSEEYRKQIDSWFYGKLARDNARTKEEQYCWQQAYSEDHLYYCECAIAVLMEMGGLIGANSMEQLEEKAA